MAHPEKIILRGLTQNNLKNVSLEIPKEKIVVFTGVSGSGKSSIVFDTVAAESQRQMNETYTAFMRGRLPKYEKPKADLIENLSPSVVIDQTRLGGNARSTVGTISDLYAALRLLYSRIGEPYVGTPTETAEPPREERPVAPIGTRGVQLMPRIMTVKDLCVLPGDGHQICPVMAMGSAQGLATYDGGVG